MPSTPAPALTVCHVTHRAVAHHDWFVDSLLLQCGGRLPDDVEVVFVDARLWADALARRAEVEAVVRGRMPYVHVRPKPSAWQGPDRRTRRDFFAAAAARNTGLVVGRGAAFAFADDLAVLMPGWLDAVRGAARAGTVTAGAYAKARGMVVREGVLLEHEVSGRDVRWDSGSDAGPLPTTPGHLFGCSLVVPAALAFLVNGFDEAIDPIGGEDYDFGFRLLHAGARLVYDRRVLTVEDDGLHHAQEAFPRVDKRMPDGRTSSHHTLDRVQHRPDVVWTLGLHDLARTRRYWREHGAFPPAFEHGLHGPTHHWPDGQPLAEM